MEACIISAGELYQENGVMAKLQDTLQEREELLRRYRREKKDVLDKLCASSSDGKRLKRFIASLNHFGPDHADRMIEYVRSQHELWINRASENVQAAVLEAISNRIVKIRMRSGLEPFDDPLPDHDDDVFFTCKRLLGL